MKICIIIPDITQSKSRCFSKLFVIKVGITGGFHYICTITERAYSLNQCLVENKKIENLNPCTSGIPQ